MIAYHFVGKTLRDGRPVPANGEWLIHKNKIIICESGLHASKHPSDALQYAPGQTLCLVECRDIVQEQADKFVCKQRKIIKRFDATDLLWEMSRWYALQVIHLWKPPPVVVKFLETGDESLRDAAGAAAWAARAAAGAAAWAAAGAAAGDAAGAARAAAGAARDAAGAAAWAAAGDAAGAARAARAAAGEKQRAEFLKKVTIIFEGIQ